ncbi:MAG: AsmA-like C-terminal region-containing protein [Pseudomonadota bacterium]
MKRSAIFNFKSWLLAPVTLNSKAADYLGDEKLATNGTESRSNMTQEQHNEAVLETQLRRKSGFGIFMRTVLAVCVCLLLLVGFGSGLAYFLLQGKTGEGSAITTSVERQLENLTGDNFDVRIAALSLDFSQLGNIRLISDNIKIVRRTDEQLLAVIGNLEVNARLLDLISGNYSFEYARINEAKLDAAVLGSGQAVFLPAHLHKPLDETGQTFARLYRNFSVEGFESFEIYNSTIMGPVLGRRQQDPITVDRLSIVPVDDNSFSISGLFRTELSDIEITSRYSAATAEEPARYVFDASGLDLQEWLQDPLSQLGFVASNSKLRVMGKLPFSETNEALDPEVKILPGAGDLRIGWYTSSKLKQAELNFRLLLDKNQIELDPSEVEIGRLKAVFVGGIKPADEIAGYLGSIRYDVIMKHGVFGPTLDGEQLNPAAFKLAGTYQRDLNQIDVSSLVLTSKKGAITGSGHIGLGGETPSIKASASTDGISVVTLKQFWPFFVASGARHWLHNHIIDGWVTSGTVTADVPPGVIFKLYSGEKLKPEHYKTVLNVKDLKFRPFGELPPIRDAKGTVTLEGMQIRADMTGGLISLSGDKPVEINTGSFVMEDFSAKDRWGETKLELEGDIQAIAAISDRKPLRVMERMKVSADQFSGEGHANIAARFPIGRKAEYDEVSWNILLELKNGASSKKLDGRKLSKANLLVDANAQGAKITGIMNIDGVTSKVAFNEPIGKSGKVKRKREIRTTLDAEGRAALGVNLDPVIDGPVDVVSVHRSGSEFYKLDFTKAKISLPWVGWSKGVDIPATGEFVLKRLKKGVRLEDFKITGAGFGGSGTLRLDKRGLVAANITNLSLNDGDNVELKVDRTDEAYEIRVSGKSYDARGVINSLVHHGEFTEAQGQRSVNLIASLDVIRGFENRIIKNVDLIYESRKGRLSRLDLRADGSEGRYYTILAEQSGEQTRFTANTNDAGNVLAFSNIYTRMEGGQLNANLVQKQNGPYVGPVQIQNFFVVNEERLKSIASGLRRELQSDRGSRAVVLETEDHRVSFLLADAHIERGKGYFNLTDAVMHNQAIGFTMNGTLYDQKNNMNISGTFMPANSVNLAVSAIPLLGQLLSNGRDNALIGVTYQLSGPRTNPQLVVNPLSIVAPGVFNKVFEFRQ